MTRIGLCLAMLLLFGGCADPAKQKLAIGQEVVIHTGSGKDLLTFQPKGGEYDPKNDFLRLAPGTKVRVVTDEDVEENVNRPIVIYILEGEGKGVTRQVSRNDVRPLP